MNKITVFFVCLMTLLVSCDKNKDAVRSSAEAFAEAINDQDLSYIHAAYPTMKEMKQMKLVDSIADKKVNVEYNATDSVYTATFEPSQSALMMKIGEDGKPYVVNSKGILRLKPLPEKLAKATGVPLKRMNDYEIATLLDEMSGFLGFISESAAKEVTKGFYVDKDQCYWVRGNINGKLYNCELRSTVTNGMSHPISGEDYQLEFYAVEKNGTNIQKYILDGVDLMPGQSHVFTTTDGVLYNYAKNGNLILSADLIPVDRSHAGVLYVFGSYNGNEFNDFLAAYPSIDINDARTFDIRNQRAEGVSEEEAGELDDDDYQIPDY